MNYKSATGSFEESSSAPQSDGVLFFFTSVLFLHCNEVAKNVVREVRRWTERVVDFWLILVIFKQLGFSAFQNGGGGMSWEIQNLYDL